VFESNGLNKYSRISSSKEYLTGNFFHFCMWLIEILINQAAFYTVEEDSAVSDGFLTALPKSFMFCTFQIRNFRVVIFTFIQN
jgi:hypothetical protein